MRINTLRIAVILSLMCGGAYAQTAFDDGGAGGAGGGSLVAVEPEVDAGTLALGSNTQVIVRFRNEASQAITFTSLNLYPTSNVTATTSMNQCSATPLALGGECAIVLNVKALKSGPFRTELLIEHSGRSKLITAVVKGDVEVGDKDNKDQILGDLQATPDKLDFGTMSASRPALRTLQLRNISEDALTIGTITLDSPQKTGFTVNSGCKDLASGQTCVVSVEWAPLLAGPSNGFLVVNHSGTSKVTTIPVEGIYEPAKVENVSDYPEPLPGKGLLIASDGDIDFGAAVDSESAQSITLVNSGDADLTIKDMTMSVAIPGLVVDPTGCANGAVLKPTSACPLTLRWAPQKKGSLMTDLRITHDGTRGILILPIRGTATAAVASGGLPMNSLALPPSPSSSTGVSTDLPGSMGLTLDDVNELNGALTGDIAAVIDRASGNGPAMRAGTLSMDPSAGRIKAAADSLSTYVVTTHSINRAVIMGPNGSRVVSHNKPVIIAGETWTPAITPDGISFTAGAVAADEKGKGAKKGTTVVLAFDPSIASNQSLLTDNSKVTYVEKGSSSSSSESDGGGPVIAPSQSTAVVQVAPEPVLAEDIGERRGSTGLPDIFAPDDEPPAVENP